MMMSGKIDAIQQQYMYTVQPVKLFGDEKRAQKTKSSFDIYSQMNPKSDFNPSHPNVKSPTMAKNLDLLA